MLGQRGRERLSEIFYTSAARRGDVFAVLDLARNPKIYSMIPRETGEALCLYDGPQPISIARVAPYLVTFKGPWDKLLDDLLAEGWGDSWGIFLSAAMTRFELRRHLRHFLKVQNDAGQNVLFRYYDPRVLLPFLTALNADERRTFFGPIDCFWVETEKGKRVAELTQAGSRLGDERITLPTTTAEGART